MARLLLASVAFIGIVGVLPIVGKQFSGVVACPSLGSIPACYLVLVGYSLIVASILVAARFRFVVFAVGWVPLFALALTGSGLELFGQNACPRSSGGIPTYYLSFVLVSLVAIIYWAETYFNRDRIV